MALESLAEPGSFLYVVGPTLALRPYEHSEVFRRGTLFRLLGRCSPCLHPQPLSPWLHGPSCPLLIPLPIAPRDGILPPSPGTRRPQGSTLRWEESWPPCWRPQECGRRGSGPSPLPGPCLLPQAVPPAKNRAAFVETQGEVIEAAACAALWLRFRADGGTCPPVSPQPLPAPWRPGTLGWGSTGNFPARTGKRPRALPSPARCVCPNNSASAWTLEALTHVRARVFMPVRAPPPV